jgi:hypothetical protein
VIRSLTVLSADRRAVCRRSHASFRIEACRALAMAAFACCDADASDAALALLASIFEK